MAVDLEDVPLQAGFGANLSWLSALQESLAIGLGKLRQNEAAINEMIARDDALRLGTQEWDEEMRSSLAGLLDPASGRSVTVGLGYPPGPAEFPFLSVVGMGGNEHTGEAIAGDEHHRAYTLVKEVANPPTMGLQTDPTATALEDDEHLCIRHTQTGTGMQVRAQVAAWTVSAELSELLISAARWGLWVQRGLLNQRGIHEYTWSEGAMNPSPELEPRMAPLPTLELTLQWTWRRTRSELVPNRVSIGGGSFSA